MERTTYLNQSINYLDSRIEFIDKKANILIGIQTALIAIVGAGLNLIIDNPQTKYALFISLFVFSSAIIILLLWTVRPTTCLIGRKTNLVKYPETQGVLWPNRKTGFSLEQMNEAVQNMDDNSILTEQKNSILVLQQLIVRKYHRYENAILFSILEILFILFFVFLHIFLKFNNLSL